MAYGKPRLKAQAVRKARLFKVLDYDPDLSLEAISQRFRLAYSTASEFKSEWKALRGIS